jgi:DNA-directed RNA polymerase subunit RPC12/RpoP
MYSDKKGQREASVYLAGLVAIAVVGTISLLVRGWVGLVAWLAIVGVTLLLLVSWHAHNFTYRCRNCGDKFEISLWTDLISPHWPTREGGWKYLSCPACGLHTKATIMKRSSATRL